MYCTYMLCCISIHYTHYTVYTLHRYTNIIPLSDSFCSPPKIISLESTEHGSSLLETYGSLYFTLSLKSSNINCFLKVKEYPLAVAKVNSLCTAVEVFLKVVQCAYFITFIFTTIFRNSSILDDVIFRNCARLF